MIVGNTQPSVTITDVLKSRDEVSILASYFNIKKLPCLMCSPLRQDNHPSFSIYLNKERKVRYIDYATEDHGGLMDLLCKYWHCSFTEALYRVYNDITITPTIPKQKKIKTFTRQELDNLSKLEVKVRSWEDYDYQYWQSYGISPKWLKYAEVYPISHKIITKIDKETNKKSKIVFGADKYAYVFVERKEKHLQLKIYQPYNTKGFKWCSKMDGSVISLWTKLPKTGEKVVICSSLKDALCLSCQLHIPTIALQGEGYSVSNTAAEELRRRFNKVFIAFDTDKVGIADGKKLSEKTGFINIIPDLGNTKDFSDYYKSLQNKQDFQNLKTLFN